MAVTDKDMIAGAALPVAASTDGVEDTAAKRKGNPFQPGHKRMGGRKKGTPNKRTKLAQDMALAMDADPVRFMLELLTKDSVQVVLTEPQTGKPVLDDAGQPQRVWVAVPLDMRLDAAKAVAAYIHPKLQATTVTGRNDGPVEVATLDVSAILANPALAAAAQELALMVVDAEQAAEND